jgi:hypothetical protein
VLFLLPELSAMVQKPSLAKQLSPLRFLDDFLSLRRSARGGVRGTGVDVARSNHHSGLASTLLLPRSSPVLALGLVLALVVAPRPVLAIRLQLVLVVVPVLDLLRALGDEVSRLAALEVLTVYFGTPSMFITLWFGFDYGTNLPLGTLII